MCTVTIVPTGKNDFVLTTNRDEAPNRVSLAPTVYSINNTKVMFPKDELSGGTWIGLSEKNRLVCVLNGGFVFHKSKKKYRKSRGIVAKDFLICDTLIPTIETYNFQDIEPFTMVIADWNANLKFFELVWDGVDKHFVELPLKPKVWSSSTLYSEVMKQKRLEWFNALVLKNELNSSSMMQFHKTAGANNKDYGVIMNRSFVKTTSITQVEKHNDRLDMHYENLQNSTVVSKAFNFSQIVNE